MSAVAEAIELVAETLGELQLRFERVAGESEAARPMDAAGKALESALAGLEALRSHLEKNNLRALSARLEKTRAAIDEQVSVVVAELRNADKENAKALGESVRQLRSEAKSIESQLASLNEQIKLATKEAGPPGKDGRGLNPVGQWQPKPEGYDKGDLVSFLGGSFISNVDENTDKPSVKSKKWTVNSARPAPIISGGGTVINQGSGGSSGLVAAPATATSSGDAGQMAYSSGYGYLCVATNTWRRWPLTTF